ncbi:MAG: NADH:flavin oxidoreductase/NADH oxidase [Paludibacter sp.]|jgi:2,4-dienoyl-CoA reductase-like NADH-dependent reductase (Old Yellow Enzyme family)|nr:NADH:flavin oxidoreductase/NADH oxidase [Paludibacter sp.]
MNVIKQFNIKSVSFRNRIGMAPMCQYSAHNGLVADWHLQHYASRAVGGVGLVIVEAAAVVPEGRITPYDLGLWSDEHIPSLTKLASLIKEAGAVAAIQLAHAGRKASHDKPSNGGKFLSIENGGWQTVAPSPIAFEKSEETPIQLDAVGISSVVSAFRDAAIRVRKAGFQVAEIHAAHGYLLHQFLSPLSNKRKDEYGGSYENRIRLLLEVVAAVKSVWPDELPLFVRLSATDWTVGGWTEDETVRLASILKERGVDLIDCSSGGNVADAKIPVGPGYQLAFAESVRSSGVMTSAVGLITRRDQIEYVLQNGKADIVLLGRELLRNPYFVMSEFPEQEWPEQYLRSKQ